MSNHSDLTYQPSETGQQPAANEDTGNTPVEHGTTTQEVPTAPHTPESVVQDAPAGEVDRTSLQSHYNEQDEIMWIPHIYNQFIQIG